MRDSRTFHARWNGSVTSGRSVSGIPMPSSLTVSEWVVLGALIGLLVARLGVRVIGPSESGLPTANPAIHALSSPVCADGMGMRPTLASSGLDCAANAA